MIILRVTSKLMFPFILLFGAYVAVHGHLTPGGSFPAGAIIASAFLLYALVYSVEHEREEIIFSEVFEELGLVAVGIAISLVMLLLYSFITIYSGTPLQLFSALPLFFIDIFGAVEVAAGITIIAVIFVAWRDEDVTKDD